MSYNVTRSHHDFTETASAMAESKVLKDLPKMEYRRLGRSGLQVSAISLGGWITFGGHVNDGKTPGSSTRSAMTQT